MRILVLHLQLENEPSMNDVSVVSSVMSAVDAPLKSGRPRKFSLVTGTVQKFPAPPDLEGKPR